MSLRVSFWSGGRFWTVLTIVSAIDGIAAMGAYAFLYGYLNLPNALDPDALSFLLVPVAGFEFVAVLLLIAAANLFGVSRVYGFRVFDMPWIDRNIRPTGKAITVGVLSMLSGGLGTVLAIRAFTDGVSIFDRGAGYFVALTMTVVVVVLVAAPAIVYGENRLRTGSCKGGSRSSHT